MLLWVMDMKLEILIRMNGSSIVYCSDLKTRECWVLNILLFYNITA